MRQVSTSKGTITSKPDREPRTESPRSALMVHHRSRTAFWTPKTKLIRPAEFGCAF
jgi:hypothetical protein